MMLYDWDFSESLSRPFSPDSTATWTESDSALGTPRLSLLRCIFCWYKMPYNSLRGKWIVIGLDAAECHLALILGA